MNPPVYVKGGESSILLNLFGCNAAQTFWQSLPTKPKTHYTIDNVNGAFKTKRIYFTFKYRDNVTSQKPALSQAAL